MVCCLFINHCFLELSIFLGWVRLIPVKDSIFALILFFEEVVNLIVFRLLQLTVLEPWLCSCLFGFLDHFDGIVYDWAGGFSNILIESWLSSRLISVLSESSLTVASC